MATISAVMVKELREKTGAGMMDCKEALTECEKLSTDELLLNRLKKYRAMGEIEE